MKYFKVLTTNNPEWVEIINNCIIYDFYHTSCYHDLDSINGSPIMLVGQSNNVLIALPLIIRSIPNTNYFDATSVYGYCGPISNLEFDNIEIDFLNYFKKEALNYFNSNNIISVFSRLHPIIKQESFFSNFGTVVPLNKTIAINLQLSLDEQRAQYGKSNKNQINKLRKSGFEIREAATDNDIIDFINIYHETMRRVNATDNYYFDKNYFTKLLNNNCYKSILLLAIHDGQIAAGSIFTICNSIMQYHLSGTSNNYLKNTPMKLLIDEARLIGSSLKLHYFHLGGGVGGSDSDSLFLFKESFSKTLFQFKIWKLIVNNNIYDKLVIEKHGTRNIESEYFPLYRL